MSLAWNIMKHPFRRIAIPCVGFYVYIYIYMYVYVYIYICPSTRQEFILYIMY